MIVINKKITRAFLTFYVSLSLSIFNVYRFALHGILKGDYSAKTIKLRNVEYATVGQDLLYVKIDFNKMIRMIGEVTREVNKYLKKIVK